MFHTYLGPWSCACVVELVVKSQLRYLQTVLSSVVIEMPRCCISPMAWEEVHCSCGSCVVVLWVAALQKGTQMKSVVTKSLANVWPQSTEMASQHRWQEVPWHRAGCQTCSGAGTAMCLSCYSQCFPKILLCSLDLFVNSCTYFMSTYMWAGKVIKGRYLFPFPLSLLVWFGTGTKGHVPLWLKLGYRWCRSLAILWGLELSFEWYCQSPLQCAPGIPLPWREFCH